MKAYKNKKLSGKVNRQIQDPVCCNVCKALVILVQNLKE